MTLCCAINSTSARNKQSIFVLLSHHQKCTQIGEITVGIAHESLIRIKIPHNFSWWQVLQFIYWLTFRSGVFMENNE